MGEQTDANSIRSIFVAIDFSDTSELALERASELAREHGARLALFHALSSRPVAVVHPDCYALLPDSDDRSHKSVWMKLEELAEPLRGEGIEATSEVEIGSARPTLLAGVRAHRPDLVVVGTRGLTGFAHFLLGSVAEAIVRRARCPVLTVHRGDTGPLDAVKTVLIPWDYSNDATLATEAGLRLLAKRSASVRFILLHVIPPRVPLAPLAGTIPEKPVERAHVSDRALVALEATARLLRPQGIEVETIVREGDPATVITKVAGSAGAGLIAMGTRGRSGVTHLLLGSTAERVVQHAPCPALTVRRVHC